MNPEILNCRNLDNDEFILKPCIWALNILVIENYILTANAGGKLKALHSKALRATTIKNNETFL